MREQAAKRNRLFKKGHRDISRMDVLTGVLMRRRETVLEKGMGYFEIGDFRTDHLERYESAHRWIVEARSKSRRLGEWKI